MFSTAKIAGALVVLLGVSSAAPDEGQQGLRQSVSRRAQTSSDLTAPTTTVYCNSIGCPAGYIPIIDASTTVCDDGECTTEQCCDAFCWGFACTTGTPNPDTVNDECPDTGCTAELCCVEPTLYCSSFGCPNGYIPIPDATTTECDDDVCTVDQCCVAFCWGYGCPDGYIPNYETINDECPVTGCTTDLCCVEN